MNIVGTFSKILKKRLKKSPEAAKRFLRFGWQFQDMRYRYFPVKELPDSDRFLAHMMMNRMLSPLKTDRTVIVSAFVPCELIHAAGLTPYNVESFSSYLSGSRIEDVCIKAAEDYGIADTLCSYHKVFIGGAILGLMPKPRCIVYTNVACDANLITFTFLRDFYNVPLFNIEVPYSVNEESISFVEKEMRELKAFLEDAAGKTISEEALKKSLETSKRTVENRSAFRSLRSLRSLSSDIVSPLYASMSANVFLGTDDEEKYTALQLADIRKAGEKRGLFIYWMHVIPFWSDDVKKCFAHTEKAQICGCEIGDVYTGVPDPERPYYSMSERLVENSLNGSSMRRIRKGIENAKTSGADGVIWFNHWGCKRTAGMANLAKAQFEEAGIPFLAVDGDGADRKNGSEGRLLTRIEAFLEMLDHS